VGLIELAQAGAGGLGFIGATQHPLHLGPDIKPRGIGDGQIHVIAAGVQRGQHGKNGLAAIERDGSGVIFRHAERSCQPQKGRQD